MFIFIFPKRIWWFGVYLRGEKNEIATKNLGNFPEIWKIFPKIWEIIPEIWETFPKIWEHFPKISKSGNSQKFQKKSGISPGSGYTNGTYPLGVSGGGGSGCTGTFTISGGGLTSITIVDAGTGYTSAPTLSFPGAGAGTGASATATLGTGASATAVVGLGASASISGAFTNAKRMRFTLNNALNDLKLSQNARCVVETCNIPSITNQAGKYVLLRLVTSTQDKACDTNIIINGYIINCRSYKCII
jgi:hypothetical protein